MKQPTEIMQSFSEKVLGSASRFSKKWREEKYSSRRVVKEVKQIVGNGERCVQAYAVLLALETRVDERYGTLFKTLFRYFAWKRESKTLSAMKTKLKIPLTIRLAQSVRSRSAQPDGEGNADGERSGDGKKSDERETKREKNAEEELPDQTVPEREREQSEKTDEWTEEAEIGETKRETEGVAESEDGKSSEPLKEKSEFLQEKRERAHAIGRSDEGRAEEIFPKKKEKTPSRERDEKSRGTRPHENGRDRSAETRLYENGRERSAETRSQEAPNAKNSDSERRFRESDVTPVLSARAAEEIRERAASSERYEFYAQIPAVPARSAPQDAPVAKEAPVIKNAPPSGNAEQARPFEKIPLSEENQARIEARERFAKMSEEDLTAIRQAMQESLNREMAQAEERGEIYKMPITVKEAFEKSDGEQSERNSEPEPPKPIVNK